MGAWLWNALKPLLSLVVGIFVDRFIAAFKKEQKAQADEKEAKARDEEAKREALEKLKEPAKNPAPTPEEQEKALEKSYDDFLDRSKRV